MPKAGSPWQFLAVAVRIAILFSALALGASGPAFAQCGQVGCSLCPAGMICGIQQIAGTAACVSSPGQSCGCSNLPCNPPVNDGVTRTASQTNGVWKIRTEVAVTAPDNSKHTFTCTADASLFGSATPPGSLFSAVGACHSGNWDKFRLIFEVENLTCANLDSVAALKTYSLSVTSCTGSGCQKRTDIPSLDLSLAAARQLLGCPVPPPVSGCPDDRGCSLCLGPGNGASPAGGGAGAAPDGSGPGARLRYSAGGAGSTGLPAAAPWAATLGRGWSHDHAERIVVDPDAKHVWLITRFATFREFTDAAGDGTYETAAPSDEYRKLTKTATGWDLKELDGTIHRFDSAGLWTQTADRNSNTITGTYASDRLSSVSFPDGRSETFAYHPSGKLASITEVGVGGAASRIWSYVWTGDDLTRINRPDGTAWTFQYGDASHPGYLTRMTLVGTDASERIEGVWEYDTTGNVTRTWKGAATATDPAAVEVYQFSFDNPSQPASTTVTDPLGKVSTYQIGRDTRSRKPRLAQLSGDCPACGLGPNSQLVYNDSANPLLPTEQTDGRGNRTVLAYNANGRLTARTEAFGTPLARTTSWTYDSTFPDFPARTEQTSTFGGASLRATDFVYSPQGDLLTRTETGVEDGSAFSLSADSTFNAAGQPLTINPPGSGTGDQTEMTYDSGRGHLIPLTRIEPLIGTTSYTHDAFNRRTQVTDVNGVVTETQYDPLNRPTQVRQVGAAAAQDRVTTYTYNAFGDLFRTTLPQGNLIEYGYDSARRLISIERKLNASTPGERTFYTLDKFGHRTKEETQRWSGTAWVTDSFTSFVYSSRCHLDKVVQADGSAIEYAYDCSGNLSQVWDANHPKASASTPSSQTYAYDALNRLTSVTQPWPAGGTAVTSYAYDVQDHLTQVTDAEGNVTFYTYGDRDLMTEENSTVSGLRTYAYNDHGELTSETDARGVTVTRTLDALDRVTFVDYPGEFVDVTYTYDDPAVLHSKGRLTEIRLQNIRTSYTYDRFGRVLRDGDLVYSYDKNGNRLTVTYPDGVVATTTYDFLERPKSLTAQVGLQGSFFIVTNATYKALGPLSSLTFGNGVTETRAFDNRSVPTRIQATRNSSTLLDWTYTTDFVGNITAIGDALVPARNRTYAYLDQHYFLTQGNGPWGNLAWTYDKIGNRLTETRAGSTETYTYLPNPAGGHDPRLDLTTTTDYTYDAIGDVTRISSSAGMVDLTYDPARRLDSLQKTGTTTLTGMLYDGRGFLWRAGLQTGALNAGPVEQETVQSTYGSEGRLYHWKRDLSIFQAFEGSNPTESPLNAATAPSSFFTRGPVSTLYFGDRPVATIDQNGGFTQRTLYLTTDHLGTPILATAPDGSIVWQGGFEPFGKDWNGAGGAGVFLRFPGQWVDRAWDGTQASLYQNVRRWYYAPSGRYDQPDPASKMATSFRQALLLVRADPPYGYGLQNPLTFIDPLGLASVNRNQCITQWIAVSGTVGLGIGAAIGGAAGGTAGAGTAGTACSFVAPGIGTLGCGSAGGVAGGAGGAIGGAKVGAFTGSALGAFFGALYCPEDCDTNREERRKTHEHCLRLYEICVSTPGRHKFEQGKKCGDCFNICRSQGAWPFDMCGLNYYPHGL